MIRVCLFALVMMVPLTPALAQTSVYAECEALAEYRPVPGVAYDPGVDVHGNAVVPADLNAAPMELPDIMSIPLSIDLARRLPDPPEGMEADASVGFLEVYKDGRIMFEGQDWTPQVYAICRGEEPPPLAGPEDGQAPVEAVESGPVIRAPNSSEAGGVVIQGGEGRTDRYN